MLVTGRFHQAVLKDLRLGEQGIITRIYDPRDTVIRKLRSMQLTPGRRISIEQRFPRFVVRVGNTRHALEESMMSAIYVRPIGN